MSAFFSVIIPAYNAAEFIFNSVDSILKQSFKDYELILVDDGSTDSTPQICDEYANQDARVRVIHQANAGPAAARNAALDIVQGDFILFCDSDDAMMPDLMQTVHNTIEQTNADCIGWQTLIETNEKQTEYNRFLADRFDLRDPDKKLSFLIQDFFFYHLGWELWNHAFRRDIIQSHNLRMCTTSEHLAEDMGFVFSYLLFCNNYLGIENNLYVHNMREGSIVARYTGQVKLNSMNEISAFVYPVFLNALPKQLHHRFPLCHVLFLQEQYRRIVESPNYNELVVAVNQVQNKKWYRKELKRFLLNHRYAIQYLSADEIKRLLMYGFYCYHKNPRLYAITSYLYYKQKSNIQENDTWNHKQNGSHTLIS